MPSNNNRDRRDDRSKNFGRPGNQDNKRNFSNSRKSSGGERSFGDSGRSFEKKESGYQRGENPRFGENRFDKKEPNFRKNNNATYGERNFDRKDGDFKKRDGAGFGDRNFERKDGDFKKRDGAGFGDRSFGKKGGDFKKRDGAGFGDRNFDRKGGDFKKRDGAGFGDRNFDRKGGDFKKRDGAGFGERSFDRKGEDFKKRDGAGFGERSFDKKGEDFKKRDGAGFGERSFDKNEKRESARGYVRGGERNSVDRRSGDSTPFYQKKSYNNTYDNSPQAQEERAQRQNRRKFSKPKSGSNAEDDHKIRLNRYISNSGICSRRKADELIGAGVVTVNGEVVTEMGFKVDPYTDDVRYNGERLKREKMVYILLNKPKDYITTTDDPQERRTVMHLIANATKERVYPVGRLDRNTTGLLLLTNDGNLADKLSHPRNNITKIYHVTLNKNLAQGDFNKIEFGVDLEDGFVKPDELSFVQGAGKDEVGIKIHSGKNRIVRRIFESLGYDVIKLDRVIYANLSKKDLPRGRWRYLDEKELVQLKHLI